MPSWDGGWRPEGFDYGLWGCELAFRFPAVKLDDYRQRWEELASSENPFAVVVMAHLKARETRSDPAGRLHSSSSIPLALVRLKSK
ncbi:hypothetical protein [Methylohalobius crimeensis]|uniref:hypothetical protein n=1 Tax=Methylohalobius crimeensis TaxID=244365 RepID=UPI00190F65C2|nr:hypothetical protein [Methylohalobius crimeensis]